jgi:hypothetical protein
LCCYSNNQNSGRPQPTGPNTGEFLHHQKLGAGSGAYAHASESGLIAVNTNASGSRAGSLTLSPNPS